MKKFLVFMGLIGGLFMSPAIAGETVVSDEITVDTVTSSYVKKDDAYWTRVWYQKQAAKGKHYKNRKYRSSKSKRSSKKRYNKRKAKRSSRSYGPGRVLAKVDISSQTMNVYKGGRHLYSWKVSTGRKGYGTPTGTWKIHRMHKEYYSRKYDGAPMPYAMFYHRGFAVHGTGSISRLGRPASHGCVRLHPANAAKLFSMVRRSGGTVKVTY